MVQVQENARTVAWELPNARLQKMCCCSRDTWISCTCDTALDDTRSTRLAYVRSDTAQCLDTLLRTIEIAKASSRRTVIHRIAGTHQVACRWFPRDAPLAATQENPHA